MILFGIRRFIFLIELDISNFMHESHCYINFHRQKKNFMGLGMKGVGAIWYLGNAYFLHCTVGMQRNIHREVPEFIGMCGTRRSVIIIISEVRGERDVGRPDRTFHLNQILFIQIHEVCSPFCIKILAVNEIRMT